MSTDYTTYIGPYIQVHDPPKQVPIKVYTCPNEKCGQHKKLTQGSYCSTCGTKMGHVNSVHTGITDYDVADETDDRLMEELTEYKPYNAKNDRFYLGNRERLGFSFDPTEKVLAVELSLVNSTEVLNKFKVIFSKDITRMEEVFGKENVAVKWGILSWMW